MERVVPWAVLVALIAPEYLKGKDVRPPFCLETMPRTQFLQLWFTRSDPTMEETFYDVPLYWEFAKRTEFTRLPDESTIHCFGKNPSPGQRLEKYQLPSKLWAWSTAF